MAGYNLIKPIPNTPACEKAGYEAGEQARGNNYCYSDCSTKSLSSCKNRVLLLQ